MATDEPKGPNGRVSSLIYLLIAVIGGGGGGGIGSYLWVRNLAADELQEIARPYPFTSKQASVLEARIVALERSDRVQERAIALLPPREMVTEMVLLRRELELMRTEISKLATLVDTKVAK